MISRWIVHFEVHRGEKWDLKWGIFGWPLRIHFSVKRAPYPGQVVFDKGWGWRKMLMCDVCSGRGYFDTDLRDERTVMLAEFDTAESTFDAMLSAAQPAEVVPAPQSHAEPRADDDRVNPADLPAITGERVSDGWQNIDLDDWVARDDWGRPPEHLHYGCDFPCYRFHDA